MGLQSTNSGNYATISRQIACVLLQTSTKKLKAIVKDFHKSKK